MSVFVIAEAACTWRARGGTHKVSGAEHDTVRALADQAKQAGADALKIQWCSDGAQMGQRRQLSDTYPLLQFEPEFLMTFHDLCVDRELEPMCTVFLPQDVAVIAPYMTRYKVSSLEARSIALRDAYLYQTSRKPLYVSTGCMMESDVASGLALWAELDAEWLHCIAAYPLPLASLNLKWAAGEASIAGLSDHTGSTLTGAVAVGAGLTVIEKHIKPAQCDPRNPDCTHSLTPAVFGIYVSHIREAELLYGDGEKRIQPCELPLKAHRVLA